MITVLAANGFIGSNIIKKLKRDNVPYFAYGRSDTLQDRQFREHYLLHRLDGRFSDLALWIPSKPMFAIS